MRNAQTQVYGLYEAQADDRPVEKWRQPPDETHRKATVASAGESLSQTMARTLEVVDRSDMLAGLWALQQPQQQLPLQIWLRSITAVLASPGFSVGTEEPEDIVRV